MKSNLLQLKSGHWDVSSQTCDLLQWYCPSRKIVSTASLLMNDTSLWKTPAADKFICLYKGFVLIPINWLNLLFIMTASFYLLLGNENRRLTASRLRCSPSPANAKYCQQCCFFTDCGKTCGWTRCIRRIPLRKLLFSCVFDQSDELILFVHHARNKKRKEKGVFDLPHFAYIHQHAPLRARSLPARFCSTGEASSQLLVTRNTTTIAFGGRSVSPLPSTCKAHIKVSKALARS